MQTSQSYQRTFARAPPALAQHHTYVIILLIVRGIYKERDEGHYSACIESTLRLWKTFQPTTHKGRRISSGICGNLELQILKWRIYSLDGQNIGEATGSAPKISASKRSTLPTF